MRNPLIRKRDLAFTGLFYLACASAGAAITIDIRPTNAWNNGYQAEVFVRNGNAAVIDGWRLDFVLGSTIQSAYRTAHTGSDPHSFVNLSYNARIAPGATENFGFIGVGRFDASRLRDCRFNGQPCSLLVDGRPAGGGSPPPPPPPPPPEGRLVLSENFNNHGDASFRRYSLQMVGADFGGVEARSSGAVRGFDGNGLTWRADNRVGAGVLRANYPANSAGGVNTGFLFDKRLPDTEEATFEYRVRFQGTGASNEFFWAAGGKLPGLGGSSLARGIPVGCTQNPSSIENGFSARLMWRRGGDLVVYTYLPDRTGTCGTDLVFFTGAQPNRWYTLRQRIKLNTPGQRNGVLEMYVDGVLRLRRSDMFYRAAGKSAVRINDVLFHTYRGGSDTDARFFSPNNDWVQFDDFRVWVR